ncbi:MAG: oligosaccharide flippase family protein [Acidaminococcaceae bacterium]
MKYRNWGVVEIGVYAKKKVLKQFGGLLFSNYFSIVLAFVTNILMTHAMYESDYGYYKYAMSIISMSVVLINGGIHYSAARLIAIGNINNERAILATVTILMIIISAIYTILGELIILIIDKFVFTIDLVVFWTVPLVFSLMLQRMFTTVLKGNNRINDIIIQMILPQAIILLFYLWPIISNCKITFQIALVIFGVAYLLVHFITWFRLKLKYPSNFIFFLKEILQENKTNGFQLYKGAIAGVFVGDVLTVIVGSVVEKSIFGMYALALSMSAPIYTIPTVIATIMYRDNANSASLSKKNIMATFFLSFCGLIALNFAVKIFFPIFFEARYDKAIDFLMICSFTFLIHGLGDYFNQFSASHGFGDNLKKGAYLSGCAQIISALFLIPKFGINGLIFSKLMSSTVYCGSMIYIYMQYKNAGFFKKGEADG